MKITKRQLRRLVEQEVEHDLSHELASDIEPREDAFAGGDNLVHNVNYNTLGDIEDEDFPAGPESLSLTDDSGVIVISEATLRSVVRLTLRNFKRPAR